MVNYDQTLEPSEWHNSRNWNTTIFPLYATRELFMKDSDDYSTRKTLSHAELELLVAERTEALRKLSQRLLTVQDEERRKVARDLHDSTGQLLAAIKISISLLEQKVGSNGDASGLLKDISSLADQALQDIRTTSHLLHPPMLDEAGFASAATWYVESFAKRSGIEAALDFDTEAERLPRSIETALFRVLQESLTNVHRHSRSQRVTIRLQRTSDEVMLQVWDRGHGIPAELLDRFRKGASSNGVGLTGMGERLKELNGTLDIESDAHGTSIRAKVPLNNAAQVGAIRAFRRCREYSAPRPNRKTSFALISKSGEQTCEISESRTSTAFRETEGS